MSVFFVKFEKQLPDGDEVKEEEGEEVREEDDERCGADSHA